MDTFKACLRSDRHAKPEEKTYRFLTLAECKSLHGHCLVIDRNGKIANVAITSVKTWKTRPDVQIGRKFGLYEFGKDTITSDDDNKFFVCEVQDFEEYSKEQMAIAEFDDKAEGTYIEE